MIEVEGLVKSYGSFRAVDGLSFRVETGEILGLVGPNGAGKTTTLRCMTGIIPPQQGRVRIDGHDLATEPVEAKSRLAFVPDEPRLFDHLTVSDHLTIMSRIYGVTDGAARGAELLDWFGLGDRKNAFPTELSRGMKQKLMICLALLHRPAALVLDEPLTGLDPAAMRRMRERIRRTAADGTAILISSHMLHLVGQQGIHQGCGMFVPSLGPHPDLLPQQVHLAGHKGAVLDRQPRRERIKHLGHPPLVVHDWELALVATQLVQPSV